LPAFRRVIRVTGQGAYNRTIYWNTGQVVSLAAVPEGSMERTVHAGSEQSQDTAALAGQPFSTFQFAHDIPTILACLVAQQPPGDPVLGNHCTVFLHHLNGWNLA
jgi:hypothetical protein